MQKGLKERVERLFPDLRVKDIEEPRREVKKGKPPVCYLGGNAVKMHP
jgi:hypothetical protein